MIWVSVFGRFKLDLDIVFYVVSQKQFSDDFLEKVKIFKVR